MINLFSDFFLQLIIFLASIFHGSFGLSIITLTIAVRLLLYPLIAPSIKSQRKIASLKPELEKLKKKYQHNKTLLNQKQIELYQQHNINPVSGCLPQIIQLGLLIVFYRVLIKTLNGHTPDNINLNFLWMQLNQPDKTYILPILAGTSQFILGLMISPGADTSAEKTLASQTKTTKDDKQAEAMGDMAQAMQTQMVFVMPIITVLFASRFPSGLALYWVTSTVFGIIQQYSISGPGGLGKYLSAVKAKIKKYK